jgi:hypothetical protein
MAQGQLYRRSARLDRVTEPEDEARVLRRGLKLRPVGGSGTTYVIVALFITELL